MNQKDSIRELLARKPQPLMSQDGVPELDKRVLFRLGHSNGWKWTAYEAEEQDGDIRCFGRVDGWESELGYFSVDEVLDNGGFRLAPSLMGGDLERDPENQDPTLETHG